MRPDPVLVLTDFKETIILLQYVYKHVIKNYRAEATKVNSQAV